MSEYERQRRWRLVLGQDAEREGGERLSETDRLRDASLDYLYRREYQARSHGPGSLEPSRKGGQEASQLTPVRWLEGVRRLFPSRTVEILQRQAIERYQLTALLRDPEVLRQATPNIALVQTLLSFRAWLPDSLMDEVRRIIRQVCEELDKRLARTMSARIEGRRSRQAQGGRPAHAALNWPLTLRRNLRHYDREGEVLLLERLYYNPFRQRQAPWEIILLIDQSGSMSDSVIHAAAIGGIFSRLRSLSTRVLLFDTQVVDVSAHLDDPVETLLAVQLGGGTDIGRALIHAQSLIAQPRRCMLVLLSDFEEGADPAVLFATVARLAESGVALLGLAALDAQAQPAYDQVNARELMARGMQVAAMTPEHLADWVGACMAGHRP
ncbi:MAG: VWA domain-containing protein [Pseudomonadota bacterium]